MLAQRSVLARVQSFARGACRAPLLPRKASAGVRRLSALSTSAVFGCRVGRGAGGVAPSNFCVCVRACNLSSDLPTLAAGARLCGGDNGRLRRALRQLAAFLVSRRQQR